MKEPPEKCGCGYPAEKRRLIPTYDGDQIDWRCTKCVREMTA